MIRTSSLSLGLVLAGTTAFAGNLSEPVVVAPVVAPVIVAPSLDWSGFYAGAQYTLGEVSAEGTPETLDVDGFGVHAGYLYDLGSFVLGGELDYEMLELSGGGGSADVDATRLKAIAGYDLGSFMPYLTAGAIQLSGDGFEEDGTFYGLGGKYQVTDNIRLGAEYLVHTIEDAGADVDVDTFSLRASYNF